MNTRSYQLNDMSLEDHFRQAASRNHVNEFSYLVFLYRIGEENPFSKFIISARSKEAANQRCIDTVERYAKEGHKWEAIAISFPTKYHTVYTNH